MAVNEHRSGEPKRPVGNILGSARAESDDKMLHAAFLETADYRALTETDDFNFVVGRRGAGKSALFRKVAEAYEKDNSTFLFVEVPSEHQTLALEERLQQLTLDYNGARAVMRLVWRTHLLLQAVQELNRHYKISKSSQHALLRGFEERHKAILAFSGPQRCLEILKEHGRLSTSAQNLPNQLAIALQVERLQQAVRQALIDTKRKVVVLIDGLDEGWKPTPIATAILGALAQALAEFEDSKLGIHGLAFVRDNMFRALAHFDADFSRTIEGNTLRLHWREGSLFALVAKRLRVALDLTNVENDVKVWNRFAQSSLKERRGFEKCLQHTLYRPRDILVLLNRAYAEAAREERSEIIESDIEASAASISRERLIDLIKEYETVLPGLGLFIQVFEGKAAFAKLREVLSLLESAVGNSNFSEYGSGDFALFSSGREILSALYSVGFIGFRDMRSGRFVFCHDGSTSELDPSQSETEAVVHPCYWRALNLASEAAPEEVAVQVEDDKESTNKDDVADLRIKLLGQIVSQLPSIPLGNEGSRQFEEWVMRTIKILFAGTLSNFEWKPNAGAIQQRDIVATDMATSGVWRRILEDYQSRQVIFEVKNYETLKPEDFRQVSSYLTGDYGRFAIVVTRSPNEALDSMERGWVKETWTSHGQLILLIPARLLSQWASKLRSDKRFSYVEEHLGRRMDTFVRSYLSLRHERPYRGKGRAI